jgi:hypothetical protein
MSEANKIIEEIVHMHEENITAARGTAERAVAIGVKLHQLKASVPHGEFLPILEKKAKAISERTCRNYMTLASERLIEERSFQLLEEKNHSGKSATVADLALVREAQFIPPEVREQAEKEMEEVDWNKLPMTVKQLVKGVNNREITQLYRDYGVTRQNQAKVYHAPKKLTVEEELEAQNATVEALLATMDNACAEVCMDLEDAKNGLIVGRAAKARLKDSSRQLARAQKLIKAAMKTTRAPKVKPSKAVAKR